MDANSGRPSDFEYDVALSFAGEQREYVDRVADALRDSGVRVFYDAYEKAELWGKDLYEHLHWVYSKAARYCVVFASAEYAAKLWTNHERRSAQERAVEASREYVLPARFDETEIPGIRSTVGYQDARALEPEDLAELVRAKLGPRQRDNFMPPRPDLLYPSLGADDDEELQVGIDEAAAHFFRVLSRMSQEERAVVYAIFSQGCPAELPDNVHVNVDLIRRETEFPPAEIKKILGGIYALGFKCSIREESPAGVHELRSKDDELLVIEWRDLSGGITIDRLETTVAYEMVRRAQVPYCEEHGREALGRLDFSAISSATYDPEAHQLLHEGDEVGSPADGEDSHAEPAGDEAA